MFDGLNVSSFAPKDWAPGRNQGMKYYLQTQYNQLNEITPQTYGRVIKELERFGYERAANVLRSMRKGALSGDAYICNATDTKVLRTARGSTPLTKSVLRGHMGDGSGLTLRRTAYVDRKAKRAPAKDGIACPKCAHVFTPS